MQKRLITVKAETLNVYIDGDEAGVYVTYLLENHGPDDAVTFGFPVDVATSDRLVAPNGYDYVLSNNIHDFIVTDGAQPVAVEKVIDRPLDPTERPAGIDPTVKLMRRWSIMALKFERGQGKYVTVSYKVSCVARDEGFEGDTLWKYGLRTFFYPFIPRRLGVMAMSAVCPWL